jgi:hypothetical protein
VALWPEPRQSYAVQPSPSVGVRHGAMERKKDPRRSSPQVENGRGAVGCGRRRVSMAVAR